MPKKKLKQIFSMALSFLYLCKILKMHLLETKIYWKQKKHFQKPVKTVDRMYIVQRRFQGGVYDEGLFINIKVLNLFFSV